ncbi:hypothetical protein A2J04_03870 [Rhodococcus sp. EPR-279]|nr:hypothetical protein A2J02_12875 [Rhodococcus sp. EPR-147]KZF06921.1 hypothetical protein A2J04_03870 [Rhodococcus sp. EPR-279]
MPHSEFRRRARVRADDSRLTEGVPASTGDGIEDDAEIGLIEYSGGAIATNWAAILAPSYAPDIDGNLIGAAQGGLLVDPAENLRCIEGSIGCAGVAGMAIIGLGRAYDIDFGPYYNDRGRKINMGQASTPTIPMNTYCDAGLSIQYDEYDTISHTVGAALWLPGASAWLTDRFSDRPAPSNCGRIAPGNSLAPQAHSPR